jgi:hypothetical protein
MSAFTVDPVPCFQKLECTELFALMEVELEIEEKLSAKAGVALSARDPAAIVERIRDVNVFMVQRGKK